MNIIKALKSGKPIRLKNKTFTIKSNPVFGIVLTTRLTAKSWKDPEWLLSCVKLTKEQLLSNDWEVQKCSLQKQSKKH